MYNTVIFDLDGTLLNTIEDLADAVDYIQKKYDFPVHTVNEVKSHVGNGLRVLMERSIPDGKENPKFNEIFAEFKEYYQQHCQVKTSEYSGIIEMLKKLKEKNIKMAIVSNKNYKAVLSLNEIYFKDYIEVAIGENEDGGIKKKPAKDTVMLALQQLGSSVEETIYVGDSEVDRQTAINSNMDCVLVSWGFREKEFLEKLEPMAIIDKPLELIDILQ